MTSRCASALLLLALLAAPLRAQTSTADALDRLFDAPAFANAFWGALVVDAATGDTLYARNAGKSFVPASNAKLFTTAAALELIGPDSTLATRLYARGPVRGGVLEGDLIVRGGGDPSFGPRFAGGSYDTTFAAWADSLRARGIDRVAGRVIGDDDLFDDVALGFGWNWDDETYYYAAQIGALTFNDNTVDLEVRPTRPGRAARVTWEPGGTSYVQVENRTRTTQPGSGIDEEYERLRGQNRIRVATTVAADAVETEALTVENPTRYFAHVLVEALRARGIAVGGGAVDVDELAGVQKPDYDAGLLRVATHRSPPLDTLVRLVNKRSQNLYAETLLRLVGTAYVPTPDAAQPLEPGSAAAGAWVARHATWARAGVDTSLVRLRDGSGLSRHNTVTPGMTVALLRYLHAHPDPDVRRAFYDSLPVGGRDGTLRYRFRGEPAQGNVRAKTGTLSGASALAGYVTTQDGRTLAFALMANHYATPTSAVRGAQDAAVNHLASLAR